MDNLSSSFDNISFIFDKLGSIALIFFNNFPIVTVFNNSGISLKISNNSLLLIHFKYLSIYFLDLTIEYLGKYSILLTLLINNSILSSSFIRFK